MRKELPGRGRQRCCSAKFRHGILHAQQVGIRNRRLAADVETVLVLESRVRLHHAEAGLMHGLRAHAE